MESDTPGEGPDKPQVPTNGLSADEQRKAAVLIQKTYKGHRTRRQLKGFGLDASTRWYEAVRDAQYRAVTTPRPPTAADDQISSDAHEDGSNTGTSPARTKWNKAAKIAIRASADDRSPDTSGSSSDDIDEPGSAPSHTASHKERDEKGKTAKMMDLQYFLEMVDQKHRYGSNLRKYHNYWKTQDTDQSYFYWLDQGDGRDVDLPECSRARLDSEQVRYLSREERMNYLVRVDDHGRLVWAKNGQRVWTKDELYKDSVSGIVPVSDPTPKFKYNVPPSSANDSDTISSDESEEDTEEENAAGDEGDRYVNEEFHRARGISKIKHVSAAVLFNHMIRTSLKKGHKWIFVNTSFRLYIGYKQSGAFQHSSFLHGSRILAAGLIKVKDGQLRKLSPLSGHYRPPAANFRAFVHNLREQGVDMSRVSISRSYAVLVGLESYVHARKRIKTAQEKVHHEKDKLIHPDKVRLEEDAKQDKSESAKKERVYLQQQQEAHERESRERKAQGSVTGRLTRALGSLQVREQSMTDSTEREGGPKRVPGTGPEDGVPAPDGER
ncbi:hypothetical protein A1O3_07021 [Capronia epimyces CBS 606.96]|uniref:IQ domain-containing calmodulin-binding protein n=1 Tax=Capronia epimyces CBS 606.96 TaxID=1182542 RepID=W9XJP3_9EURO|nr:uncharacterized protein A1O3_07021 [Capronia epimyces CBS 606.96]EXJ80737.1 hypothetical protein A1O3_07021 [Capronia epimyces CBS 606.96]